MTMSPRMTKFMVIGMPMISFGFTFWLPAAVQLSFFITSCLSYGQMSLFQSERFRKWMGMYPMPKNYNPLGEIANNMNKEITKTKLKMREPLSQGEINSLHKPVATVVEGRIKKRGVVDYLGDKVGDVATTVSSVVSSGRDVVKQGNEKIQSNLKKDEEKEALQYEKRRSKELKAEKDARFLEKERAIAEKRTAAARRVVQIPKAGVVKPKGKRGLK